MPIMTVGLIHLLLQKGLNILSLHFNDLLLEKTQHAYALLLVVMMTLVDCRDSGSSYLVLSLACFRNQTATMCLAVC